MLRGNTDFTKQWTGQSLSALGSGIVSIAYPLLALELTGSPVQAGLITTAGLTASVVFRLPAGIVADRWPVRRTLVGVDVMHLVVVGLLALALTFDAVTPMILTAAVVFTSILSCVADSSRTVALRHTVGDTDLATAFALNHGRTHAVKLVGQPIGGLLYGIAPAVPLMVDAVTDVFSALLHRSLKSPSLRRGTPSTSRPVKALGEAATVLWNDRFLRICLLYAATVNLVMTGVGFGVVVKLRESGTPPVMIGVALAMAAVGGLIGATISPWCQRTVSPLTQLAVMAGGMAATIVTIGLVHGPLLVGGALLVSSLATAPANAMLHGAQARRTPRALQGRASAVALLLAGLAAPVAPPVTGVLLDTVSDVSAFGALAALVLASSVAALSQRALRTGLN